MIYDAHGNLWATPLRIGFHQNVQSGSHEPADAVTFNQPSPKTPEWVEQEASSQPYARKRRVP